jgi:hypothetical protein
LKDIGRAAASVFVRSRRSCRRQIVHVGLNVRPPRPLAVLQSASMQLTH